MPTRTSAPEIRIALGTAGRETLDAITNELLPNAREARAASRRSIRDSGPEISIQEGPAGRDTMAAIAEELASRSRDSLPTLPYGDRVPNAPGAISPSRPPSRRSPSRPGTAPKPPEPTQEQLTAPEIFELLTFVVQHPGPTSLSTEASRRSFVQEHLLARMPNSSMQSVRRIDVTPWTSPDTVILRVWCRLDRSV
jgi:hypothetical protein